MSTAQGSEATGAHAGAPDNTKRFARKSMEAIGNAILGATTFNSSMEQAAPHNPEAAAAARAKLEAEQAEHKTHPGVVSKVAHAIKDAVVGAVAFEHPKMYGPEGAHKEAHPAPPQAADGHHVGEQRFSRGSLEAAVDNTKRFARKSVEAVGSCILGATTFNDSMEQAAPHNPAAVAAAKAKLAAEHAEKEAHPSTASKVAHVVKDAVLGAVTFDHPKMYAAGEGSKPAST